jgi:hypothetical protein
MVPIVRATSLPLRDADAQERGSGFGIRAAYDDLDEGVASAKVASRCMK